MYKRNAQWYDTKKLGVFSDSDVEGVRTHVVYLLSTIGKTNGTLFIFN